MCKFIIITHVLCPKPSTYYCIKYFAIISLFRKYCLMTANY